MTTGSTRLSKPARREQLLDTALVIVRAHGTDNLTLLSLAEAAGVSRPIVYDHFGTRPGLLIALYRRLDDRHRTASEKALRDAPADPREIARVLSAAYFTCATDMPEWTAISAALKGNQEMEAIERELLDAYTDLMTTALRPYSGLTQEALRLRCVGALGAAESMAAELNRGRTTATEAIAALTDLTVAGLAPETEGAIRT
ncbi:TetR/AcrR family transcriptional regulator [Nonomuraea sp. NPDC050790]|uniref:TetR/AcrR family transcriptional regulator n=1 Tax=Nonomuraea sp. NPDC050790 TaxID=3364371 RepID=UPI0037AC2FB4